MTDTKSNSTVPPEFARNILKNNPEMRKLATQAGVTAIRKGEIGLGLKLIRRSIESEHAAKEAAILRTPRFDEQDFKAFNAAAGARGENFSGFLRRSCLERAYAMRGELALPFRDYLRAEMDKLGKA